jgi:hypothetical protein
MIIGQDLISQRLVNFENPEVKKITSLSKSHTQIEGAYFSASAHGVVSGDSLSRSSLN